MSLSSLYLDAFVAISRAQSFSGAAKILSISQSALSQRIGNLEDELGLSLFIRSSSGIHLTDQGQRLLRYCQTRNSLEEELLTEINAIKSGELSGHIRMGVYSSIYRSVILPALGSFLSSYPDVSCEFKCVQMGELPGLLRRNEVDFVVTDTKIEKSNVECDLLGQEQLVVIEGKHAKNRNHYFLDNDPGDPVTEEFFKRKRPKYQRSFFADCYGIIDGVEQGLGRAIMPNHLVKKNKKLRVLKEFKPQVVNVYLQYYSQPFYSQLHRAIIKELQGSAKGFLA